MTHTLRFVRQQRETDDTLSFFFQPEVPLPFVAGQYLQCTLPHPQPDARGISRSFTIASAPDEPLLRLTTRLSSTPSTFKQALRRLQLGDAVQARGPYGQFVYAERDAPAVFIAGGIGITPFRAILADLAAKKCGGPATLLYSNSDPDFAFRTFFDGLAREWPALRVVYTVTRPSRAWDGPTGRIDAAFIARHVADLIGSTFFVCGPAGLVDGVRDSLAEAGVDAGWVKHEAFPGYHALASEPSLATR